MRLSRIITVGGLVGLSSLGLAGCTLPFMPQPAADQPQNAVDQMANAAELSVMMATGQAGTCTITNTASEDQNTMNIAIKDKKFFMKGSDFSISSGGPNQEKNAKIGYMLNDTESTYIWEEGATTGIKIKAAEPASEQTPEMQEANKDLGPAPRTKDQNPLNTFEADSKYRIECQLADVADQTFVPPASVTFLDMSQGMNPAMMQQQTLPSTTNAAGQ